MPTGVSVLIPAYNEADRIAITVKALKKLDKIKEIIVINDGSSDNTLEIVNNLDVKAIHLKNNLGKGGALTQGLKEINYQIVALADADLAHTAVEFDKLIAPIWSGQADMTIAKFPESDSKSGFGLAFFLAQFGLKKLTGRKYDAPLSGQRVLSSAAINYIKKFAANFAVETALTLELSKANFKILEIPVNMAHRKTAKDWAGFQHRGRQFRDILAVLLSEMMRC